MVIITRLQTEYMDIPFVIDVPHPRLSWQLESEQPVSQTAYRILVSSSEEKLDNGDADMWDSGIVYSQATNQIAYESKRLLSKTRYYWKVQIWCSNDETSSWSRHAWWEMGLLDRNDWQAQWIRAASERKSELQPAPYLRKTFHTDKKVDKAVVYISGLGYYELFINGRRIGDHVLDSGITDYEKTVLYAAYDVSDHLKQGRRSAAGNQHVMGIHLGRGRYSQVTPDVWGWEKAPWHDLPTCLVHLSLAYEDGTTEVIPSDETWRTADSPLLSDCLYAGEMYDARAEKEGWLTYDYDDRPWEYAVAAKPPEGQLRAQTMPPIKVMRTIAAQSVTQFGEGHYILDFGEMITGWAALTASGERGRKIELRYGERLNERGTVEVQQGDIEAEIQKDVYILKGGGTERWESKFSYKGYQFIEVTGYPGTLDLNHIQTRIIHTAVKSSGSFTCSNDLFNQIHSNTRRAILNNLHSIPTDTPVYEKNGWTGDAHLTAEAAIYNFDMAGFYTKWLTDIEDSISDRGEIAPIVPTSDWGYEDTPFGWELVKGPVPAWDAAFVLIPWYCYEYYGDKRILQKHYQGMKMYLSYLEKHAEDHIITKGLGDWLAPSGERSASQGNPPEGPDLVSTANYFHMVDALVNISVLLDHDQDTEYFSALRSKIKRAFQLHFYDREKKLYRTEKNVGYRQTSNVLPLAFGLVPETEKKAVVDNLVQNIRSEHHGHLNTGIFGTKHILHVLSEGGYIDLAYEVANQTTYPGWGYWIEHGATSLWEAWEISGRSRNHHMFGSIDDWFYRKLAGFSRLTPGYRKIQIKPYLPRNLQQVEATIEVPAGKVYCKWVQEEHQFTMRVRIPTNTTAVLFVPNMNNQDEIRSGNGARFINHEEGYAVFEVGPGEYVFVS